MAEFYVYGSGGYLVCDTTSGNVLEVFLEPHEASNYNQIRRIDMTDVWATEGQNVDILTVGYWMADGTYEPRIEEEV